MSKMIIEGNHLLEGIVDISGAKNSAVALIPTAVLCDEAVSIENVPNITDIEALNDILEFLGAKVEYNGEIMKIDSSNIENKDIPESIAIKLRASYYFMGALLGRFKKVVMYFPGGCNIGTRPINLHLKGFELMGAKVIEKDNQYIIEADELKGTTIDLDIASVGATINIMLAAVKAKGITIIKNAAKEPEIENVALFLNNMGAKISGYGTNEITIEGVNKLHSSKVKVIPDRIEAGTYIIAAALAGNNVKINNIIPFHLNSLIFKLKEMGISIQEGKDYLIVSKSNNLKNIDIKTLVYPGFPTDLQQPLTTLLTQCEGLSILEETIYENRFQNIAFLNKMGADIKIDKNIAYIKGKTPLKGQEVIATDLRAGACLVLAGLIAEGKTIINEAEHILRGYEKITNKLNKIGAKIEII